MKEMDGNKRNIIWHIKSARQWLERAEQAFDAESPTRGELDLILARAEVQHAQEKRSSPFALPSRLLVNVFRHKKILGVALGGILLGVPLISYTGSYFNQNTGIPVIHSLKPRIQLEIPATLMLRPSTPLVASSETLTASSEVLHEKQVDISKTSAGNPTSIQNNVYTAIPQSVQQAVFQAETKNFVSEEEVRMLTRMADRALKNTK